VRRALTRATAATVRSLGLLVGLGYVAFGGHSKHRLTHYRRVTDQTLLRAPAEAESGDRVEVLHEVFGAEMQSAASLLLQIGVQLEPS
jgi:hypothetical protein